MVVKPEEYRWSSFKSYVGIETIPKFLFTKEISERFGSDYSFHVYKMMSMDDDEIDDLLAVQKSVMGSDKLRAQVLECAEQREGVDKDIELPEFRKLKQTSKDNILTALMKEFDVSKEMVFANKRGNIYRKLLIYGLKRYTAMKLREIGDLFNMDYQRVSSLHKYFIKQVADDFSVADLKKRLDAIVCATSKIPI